jgi:hypothetical protein
MKMSKLGYAAPLAIALLGAAAACGGGLPSKSIEAPEAKPRNDAEARVIDDFKKRVDRYEDVSEKIQKRVYPITSDANPQEIHKRQKALASEIAKALPGWKHGDIFTDEIAAFFRSRIGEVLGGPDGRNIRAAIEDDDLGDIKLQVFTEYPPGEPVTSIPPQLLRVLPSLPKEVEYRFRGKDLIIMDVAAYLIVDFVAGAYK